MILGKRILAVIAVTAFLSGNSVSAQVYTKNSVEITPATTTVTAVSAETSTEQVTIKMIETTDIHGNFFGYDFMNSQDIAGGLPRVAAYVKEQREAYGEDHVALIDNGDILQGQPCVYYANFVDTVGLHLAAEMMNYLNYDVGCYGNHDVEAGHPVYDRWVRDCSHPVLGANIISTADESNYAIPYCIIERAGVKITVLGMLTAAIPMWLPESLWSGLRFDDIVASVRHWVPIIEEKENPDVMVGLFHCGLGGNNMNGFNENAAEEIALTVPGFDIIFYGHDHRPYCKEVVNQVTGDTVWLLNPGASGVQVAETDITATVGGGNVSIGGITGRLVPMEGYEPDSDFLSHFYPQWQQVQDYVTEEIGELAYTIDAFDYFFGPSSIGDLLHTVQCQHVDVDISLVAPLTTDETFTAGSVSVKDIFKLYRYENRIEVFELSGREVQGALDKAYCMWTNTMTTADDHAIAVKTGKDGQLRMAAYSSFMLSAAGISYTVDLTKPAGEKVTITSMADGSPFGLDTTYRVAVNSYLGSGGGGLLTDGAGISMEELPTRIVYTTEKDLRYYVIDYFRNQTGPVSVTPVSNWHFVPEEIVAPALARDRQQLIPHEKH